MRRHTTCNHLILAAITLLVAAGTVQAGALTVITDPPGASVAVSGDLEVRGVTPTTFRQPLIGQFKVTASLDGYESSDESIWLTVYQADTVHIALSPKTNVKAAVRSLFIPGWGQHYAGQGTKGVMMHVLAAGSIAAFLIADHNFNIKFDHFEARRDAYDAAVARGASRQELNALLADLTRAQEDAFDHEDYRRVAIGAVIASWSISVLDALLFFPDKRQPLQVGGVQVTPQATTEQLGLKLSYSF